MEYKAYKNNRSEAVNAYFILEFPSPPGLILQLEFELTRFAKSGLVAALPLPARPCLQIRNQLFSGAGKERLDFPPTSLLLQ